MNVTAPVAVNLVNFSVVEPATAAFKSAAIGEVPLIIFIELPTGYLSITTPDPPEAPFAVP